MLLVDLHNQSLNLINPGAVQALLRVGLQPGVTEPIAVVLDMLVLKLIEQLLTLAH
jgi:hypothetical protein